MSARSAVLKAKFYMRSYMNSFKAAVRISLARTLGLNMSSKTAGAANSPMRVLFVSNAFIPTLQLSFFKPLANMIEQGELAVELLSEQQMKEQFGKRLREAEVEQWINKRVAQFNPTAVVFCRYSGPHAQYITELARRTRIPTVFHVDDDLLNVPVEIGQKKYEYHNHPLRLETVRYLLENVDVVYCSTEPLKQRFVSYGLKANFKVGGIYCSGKVLVPAEDRPVRKIGYMGFDHAHDLERVIPALIQVMRRNPEVKFELFGSIPKPAVLEEFGERVNVIPPVPNYEEFLEKFSSLNWDIGICPLAKTDFNAVKANTKWVEYTSVGTAVVASAGTIYDACCADGCGVLADTTDEWVEALESFIGNSQKRSKQVARAQQRLQEEYSVERLGLQVREVLASAEKCITMQQQ